MFPLTSCLVFACIGAVAINAELLLTQACMKARSGSTTGVQNPLRPIILPKGLADWEMLPTSQCPAETNGIVATVCDTDAIPSVKFVEPEKLVVHRKGKLQGYAIVEITFYCSELSSPEDQPSRENVETLSPEDQSSRENVETLSPEDQLSRENVETLSPEDQSSRESVETLSPEDQLSRENVETLSPEDQLSRENVS